VVHKILDYSIRVSDKAAYRSPTRGAQGNALKTVIGIPYALGSRAPLTIRARGVSHSIAPWVDPAGSVYFDYSSTREVTEGTTVSLTMPDEPVDSRDGGRTRSQDFDPVHWCRSFAAFNPHATISYQAKSTGSKQNGFYKSPFGNVSYQSYQAKDAPSEVAEIYKPTSERPIKKYVATQPTSPHWYSEESLKGLVFNHIAHARAGGRDLPLGEFVRQFQGLSSTRKAKAVTECLPEDIDHLSDFAHQPEMVATLLEVMQRESKPPKASALGWVGKEHFEAFFESTYEVVQEFNYKRNSGTLASGLPITIEFALARLGEDERGHLYCGINFAPTFGDPLQGTTLAGPKFKADGVQGFLSEGHALPKGERAWYQTPTSVAVAAHIVTPAPMFLDRGKTRLDMENA
jgi:hypothetical protein